MGFEDSCVFFTSSASERPERHVGTHDMEVSGGKSQSLRADAHRGVKYVAARDIPSFVQHTG